MEGMDSDRGDGSGAGALEKLANKLSQFILEAKGVRTKQYLLALTQLCHADTALAHSTWVELFPRLWAVLSDRQRHVSCVLISAPFFAWLISVPVMPPLL